jgi:peroxiredoxin Q/BCP
MLAREIQMTHIGVGQKAPNFKLATSDTKTVSLQDFKGKRLILYFYPKDDTPGCTTQAINFSAAKEAFAALNAEVLGVSADSLKKHEKFIAKHDLRIDLASDEAHEALEAYGVWVEKSMYGRTYMGIERSTFLIDEKGIIRAIWSKVKVKTHIEDVKQALATLG